MLIYLCGLLGNLFFGFKSLFQVIQCYRSKSSEGLSSLMLLSDFLGNILCTLYIYGTVGFTVYWQFINYGFAVLFLIVLFIMKFKYSKFHT